MRLNKLKKKADGTKEQTEELIEIGKEAKKILEEMTGNGKLRYMHYKKMKELKEMMKG
jgi:hypothetical protein